MHGLWLSRGWTAVILWDILDSCNKAHSILSLLYLAVVLLDHLIRETWLVLHEQQDVAARLVEDNVIWFNPELSVCPCIAMIICPEDSRGLSEQEIPWIYCREYIPLHPISQVHEPANRMIIKSVTWLFCVSLQFQLDFASFMPIQSKEKVWTVLLVCPSTFLSTLDRWLFYSRIEQHVLTALQLY